MNVIFLGSTVPWKSQAGVLRMVLVSASNLKCPRVKGTTNKYLI